MSKRVLTVLGAVSAAAFIGACSSEPPPGDDATAGAMPGAATAEENALAVGSGDAAPVPEGSGQPGAAPSQEAQDAAATGRAPVDTTPDVQVSEIRPANQGEGQRLVRAQPAEGAPGQ